MSLSLEPRTDQTSATQLQEAVQWGKEQCEAGNIREALFYLEDAFSQDDSDPMVAEFLAFLYGVLEDTVKEARTLQRAYERTSASGDLLGHGWMKMCMAAVHARRGEERQQATALKEASATLARVSGDDGDTAQSLCHFADFVLAAIPLSEGGRKRPPEEEAVGRYLRRMTLAAELNPLSGPGRVRRYLSLLALLHPMGHDLANEGIDDLQKVKKIVERSDKRHKGNPAVHSIEALVLLAEQHDGKRNVEKVPRRDLLRRVLKVQEQFFGRDSYYLVPTLRNLANVCSRGDGAQERQDYLRRAVDLLEEHVGHNHRQTTVMRYFLQNTLADVKGSTEGEDIRDQESLFGRRLPTNLKVNRYPAECVLPDQRKVEAAPRPPMPYSVGGGGCVASEVGISIPFYETWTPIGDK